MKAFPATLSVARGQPAPGSQMVSRGELAHVETHFRKHLAGHLLIHPGRRIEQVSSVLPGQLDNARIHNRRTTRLAEIYHAAKEQGLVC